MVPLWVGVALAIGASTIAGCSPCNREGCSALANSARDNGQSAVAGIVATESDVVENGCAECPFGSTLIEFRPTNGTIADTNAAQALIAVNAPIPIEAKGHYVQQLDPGFYLACARPTCVNIEVLPGRVTTLNVKQIYGPTQFFVGDSKTHAIRAMDEIDIGYGSGSL